MQDLQEITHEVHYENYRSEKMSSGAAARKIKSVYARIRPDSTGTRLLRAFEVAKMLRGCREETAAVEFSLSPVSIFFYSFVTNFSCVLSTFTLEWIRTRSLYACKCDFLSLWYYLIRLLTYLLIICATLQSKQEMTSCHL